MYKLHDWIIRFHWLNKKEDIFDKLKITWLWVLVTNYQIITWPFVLVTFYLKIKTKIKPRSTYPKTLNSKARLWNGKVLGTHSAQTESGLLDSCEQCNIFMHDMNDMLNMWNKNQATQIYYEWSLFFWKESDLFELVKNWFWFIKIPDLFCSM